MKKFNLLLVSLCIFSFYCLDLNAQMFPYISGNGIEVGTIAASGPEYEYLLKFEQGSLPSDKKQLVTFDVSGGVITSRDGTKPSVKIKWNNKTTRGYVYANNIYTNNNGNVTHVNINSPVDIAYYDPALPGIKIDYSPNPPIVNETIDFNVTLNFPEIITRVSFTGDDFVTTSNNPISGYFTQSGSKTVVVTAFSSTNSYSEEKTINVLPLYEIEGGSPYICDEGSFSIQGLPSNIPVNWTVSNNLFSIVSGQGTNSVIIRVNSSTTGEAYLKASFSNSGRSFQLNRHVVVGSPYLDRIDGPTSLQVNEEGLFYAKPETFSFPVNYMWQISPPGNFIQDQYESRNKIRFTQPGTYQVVCAAYNPACGSDYAIRKWIEVVVRDNRYSIHINSDSNEIIIGLKGGVLEERSSFDNSKIIYEIYKQDSGLLIEKGTLSNQGGSIHLNSNLRGVYLFNLIDGNGKETHKLLF